MTATTHTLSELLDWLEILICGLDEGGRIRVFNRPCQQLTGLGREEAEGMSWLDVFAGSARADQVVELWAATRAESPTGPYEALCRNGRSVRWQFSRGEHAELRPVTLWAVGVDVTEDREAMVRAREQERVVALGNLISGLTHELRNPLNGALLQLTLAERMLARRREATAADLASDPAIGAIAQARSELKRLSAFLDDFLVFIRPQPVHLERADVRELVARAIERSNPKAAAAGVEIALEPGAKVVAEIDPARLATAVYHLLANAIDAAAEASERAVHVRVLGPRNAAAIEIEDRGAGLPSEDTPMFEPFFTTKKGGTGLGLSIVQRVASDHGGAVAYERREGATVFRLTLPILGGVIN